jgi:hypothetical protein
MRIALNGHLVVIQIGSKRIKCGTPFASPNYTK